MKKLLVLGAAIFALVRCSTTSEISSDDLKAPFVSNKAQIEACYDKVSKKQPDLGSGTVELKFLINEEGRAYKTIFMKKRSTLSSKLLNACIKKVVHSWAFPQGKALEVVYPFQFERQSAGLSNESSSSGNAAKEPEKQNNLDVIDTSPQEDAPAEGSGDEELPTPTE